MILTAVGNVISDWLKRYDLILSSRLDRFEQSTVTSSQSETIIMANPEILKAFNEECRAGKHPLVTIYSDSGEMESAEVRWCPVCGSVVVDTDFDDRINPGAVMAMRRPKILKEIGEHDNSFQIGMALAENNGLGIAFILEAGDKKSVPVLGSESQVYSKVDDETVKKTVDSLQHAGLLTISKTGDSFSLTDEGTEICSKINRSLEGRGAD